MWQPPAAWTEVQGQLRKTGSVTLDANGNGTLIFDPSSARERWVVNEVVVDDNQSATATTIPIATVALNSTAQSTMSLANQRGTTWSGNQDTFGGNMDVGPCDFMAVIFGPPPGTSGTPLTGVICTAIVTGVKYIRRT